MKYLFLSLVIVSIITACQHKKPIDCIRPYTEKELSFIKSFESKGKKVKISRFNYPYMGESMDQCIEYMTGTYHIKISNFEYEKVANMDSMRILAKKIASNLYSNILEDSIIENTSEISVRIQSKPFKSSQLFGNGYMVEFTKSSLEKHCGFYIKTTKDGLERGKTLLTSDTLQISQEFFIK